MHRDVKGAACVRSAALGLAAALLVAGCSSDSSSQPPPLAEPVREARSGTDAYGYLKRYTELGLHRTGTQGGEKLVSWLADELRGMGLDTQVESFGFDQYVPDLASLKLDDGSDLKVFPYWYSGFTGTSGVSAELVDVGAGAQSDFDAVSVSGKLVLADIAVQSRAVFTNLSDVLKRAHAGGAAGVVAAIQGVDNHIIASNAESEAGLCGLPVLFVGAQDGRRARARAGRVASFTLTGDYRDGASANVVATIPGKSRDTLVIGTPVNGWFTTASERGGGVGTLLTLARSYAERSAAGMPPDKTLVFLFTGGHEVGFLGLQRYIDAHPDVISRTYTYVHLGAAIAGRYFYQDASDKTRAAPIADPARTLYVSENPLLQRLVSTRQLLSGLSPVQQVQPSVNNPGEQRRMYARGVPIVSISGTTLFFHTEADTADTTSADLLEPAVQFYGAVIDDLLALPAAEVLRNNDVASRFARPVPQPVCAVPAP